MKNQQFSNAVQAGILCAMAWLCAGVAVANDVPGEPPRFEENCARFLTRAEVLRGPDWLPGKPVPLKPEEAARIALDTLMKMLPEGERSGWHVAGIKSMALYGTGYRKWYYTITFYKDAPAATSHGDLRADISVGMDGMPGDVP